MSENRQNIAIYFDLENIPKELNLTALMDNILLSRDEASEAVFIIKLACGNERSIKKFREQLRDANFDIRETPHVSARNIKNRADLILTLEAFETLIYEKVRIDLYVFVTSDTDFTVVMDKLRKYGKKVWLATPETGAGSKLFSACADKIIRLDDSFGEKNNQERKDRKKTIQLSGFSAEHQNGIFQVLDSFEKDEWYSYSIFGTKIRNLHKDFSYRGNHGYNSQTKLFDYLTKKKVIETENKDGKNLFRVK